ncbi:hypothetical protein DL96DRAFT_1591021, partial [Flagelloscypha sp. PMI_526]
SKSPASWELSDPGFCSVAPKLQDSEDVKMNITSLRILDTSPDIKMEAPDCASDLLAKEIHPLGDSQASLSYDNSIHRKNPKWVFDCVLLPAPRHALNMPRGTSPNVTPFRTEGPKSQSTPIPASSSAGGDFKPDVKEDIKPPDIKIKHEDADIPLPLISRRVDTGNLPKIEVEKTIYTYQTVRRDYMSDVWGGSAHSTFPNIAEARWKRHGQRYWCYASLELHPRTPRDPGIAGFWLSPVDIIFFGEEDKKAQVSQRSKRRADVHRVYRDEKGEIMIYSYFVGIGNGEWMYLGRYTQERLDDLETAEWRDEVSIVTKKAWARIIKSDDWGRDCRITISFRREHNGRNPTREEFEAQRAEGHKFTNVNIEEIVKAFDDGDETMGMWMMRPVGYDAAFSEQIITGNDARRPEFAAKARERAEKAKATRARKKMAPTNGSDDEDKPPGKRRKTNAGGGKDGKKRRKSTPLSDSSESDDSSFEGQSSKLINTITRSGRSAKRLQVL